MRVSSYTLEDQRRMSRARNYFAWQSRLVIPELGARVLEAGCGIGNFTGALLERELVVAVDEEPSCVDALRQRFPGRANLRVYECGIESACFLDLARYELDSCVCLNVLEHVERDAEAVRRMASVLRRRGAIVLLVPAFPALFGPIDRQLDHYRRYTRERVRELARDAGLAVRKLHYFNLAGFGAWWWNARVARRTEQSARQIEIFDRFVAPMQARLEAAIKPPFGQSLFAVLQKQ